MAFLNVHELIKAYYFLRLVRSAILLSFCFSLALCLPAQNTAEILWDHYGIPHIYAKTNKELYYAFGWAEMNNHANLLLKIYAQARGRAAEYWGAEWLESDKQVLTYDLYEKSQLIYNKQSEEYKSYIDAFVKGINDFAKQHPDQIDKETKPVLPITGTDVVAAMERATFRFLTASERPLTERILQTGSNAIAIAPSRSASHHAMLIINPHLPWKPDFTLLFEADLNGPDYHGYGTTLVGMPLLFTGFNEHLGWAHTTNNLDASDRYELTLQGEGYLLDGAVVPFDKKTKLIKIKQPDGTMSEEKLELQYSKQGVVVGEKEGKTYAIRIAGLDNDKHFEEYHRMMSAKNFNEFESAVKMMQLAFFNIVYADQQGNIFFIFNGNVPKRSEGNFAFWRATIDGTKSNLIWNSTLDYDQLPKLLNPSTGFLQNANDPPWSCTWPFVLEKGKFLPYVAPAQNNLGLRPQHAIKMISNDSSITFDELRNYKLNTSPEAADRFLDDLFAAAEKYPDSEATKAVAILKSWDRKTDASSKGAELFATWFDKITPDMFAKSWDVRQPLTTPDGFKNEQQVVVLLSNAKKEVEKKYGSADIAWGEVHRYRLNNVDLPANGGSAQHGIFMSQGYEEDNDHKLHAMQGETFMAVVEFGKDVKAEVLLCYGNTTQPGSKHMSDQLKLLSDKKLRPALLTKKDVLNNLEKKDSLKIIF
jgi:acyl-homoserine-lactone acylase